MVKSFQGVRLAEPKRNTPAPILVRDHMSTNLVTFHPEDTIDQVLEVLTKRKIILPRTVILKIIAMPVIITKTATNPRRVKGINFPIIN